jgi:hypothetical protein
MIAIVFNYETNNHLAAKIKQTNSHELVCFETIKLKNTR